MIREQSTIELLEIFDRRLQVRLALLVLREDGEVVARDLHRTALELDTPVQAQMDLVNVHLEQLGRQPVPQAEIDRLAQFHALMVSTASSAAAAVLP